jgi:hypothetical protein
LEDHLKKGQRVLVHCRAERIDSRADATLTLTDAQGIELERSRDEIGRDPLIDFTASADGDYLIGVHDFLYNGGAEYTYLLTASTRPWIDGVFPPAGQEGQVIEATLLGRNLPGGSPGEGLTIDGKPLETVSVRIPVKAAEGAKPDSATPARAMLPGFTFSHEGSNPVRIGIAAAPVVWEANDADLPPLTLPCEVAARFDKEGDSDAFRFSTKASTAYWIEVSGDRLAGRVDPYLIVEKITKGADGKEAFAVVREGDDTASKTGTRLLTGSRDTSLTIAAGEAADYRVTVVNQFDSGGPTHLYRLAVREAKPDFDLFAVQERSHYEKTETHPAAPLLRKGGGEPVRILIHRRDGFEGPITVEADGPSCGRDLSSRDRFAEGGFDPSGVPGRARCRRMERRCPHHRQSEDRRGLMSSAKRAGRVSSKGPPTRRRSVSDRASPRRSRFPSAPRRRPRSRSRSATAGVSASRWAASSRSP